MKIIEGKYTSAKVFTSENLAAAIDDYALAQLGMLCDNEALSGCKVRVMPDVHAGKVGPVGLTMTIGSKVMPSLVGIDIGCGITMARIKDTRVEFQKLDSVIRDHVPSGFDVRKDAHSKGILFDYGQLHCQKSVQEVKAAYSMGTLGGGNHFIELDRDQEGNLYLVIHSGSRHLGKEVADFYLNEGGKILRKQKISVPHELTYLEGDLMEHYLHDCMVVQEFAAWNREVILEELVKGMKWKVLDTSCCIHNYVEDTKQGRMLRKGAISAKKGENVIIPINMRDGILLGIGKGNPEWNDSAPHGSGRIIKRKDVQSKFTLSQFKAEMKGIYSPSICQETLDEAPFAYRSMEDISTVVSETIEITKQIKPVYNYKAGETKRKTTLRTISPSKSKLRSRI
jgi:RNA-splicing ligase RtcB